MTTLDATHCNSAAGTTPQSATSEEQDDAKITQQLARIKWTRERSPRRLDKFLAESRAGSKKTIEALAERGSVCVNGEPRSLRRLVDPLADVVEVDGTPVKTKPPQVYALFNKPKGVLTTLSDPLERECVGSFFPEPWRGAVAPVGRLDKATTGALLLTDDGDLNYLMTHPNFHVWKRYILTIVGEPLDADPRLEHMRAGVILNDIKTRPARCGAVPDSARSGAGGRHRVSDVWIEIREGRHRQVRRMARRVGLKLIHLHRASLGPVNIDHVPEGQWRTLREPDVEALYDAAGGRQASLEGAHRAMIRRLDAGDLDNIEVDLVTRYLAMLDGANPHLDP